MAAHNISYRRIIEGHDIQLQSSPMSQAHVGLKVGSYVTVIHFGGFQRDKDLYTCQSFYLSFIGGRGRSATAEMALQKLRFAKGSTSTNDPPVLR